MNKLIRCLPLVTALLLSACGGGGTPPQTLADGPMVVETLAAPASSYNDPGIENTVVRDVDSMQKLWNRIYQNATPVPQLPTIDFSRKMVLAWVTSSNSCGGFVLDQVVVKGGAVFVNYRITPPPPNVMCVAVVVYSVHLIVVDRADTTVNFVMG